MKILLIGPVPPPHGGISVHVSELRRQLTAAGIPCEVLDTRDVRRGFTMWRYAWNGWTLHLHTNGHNAKSWWLALLCGIAGRLAAGCVLTLHSGMAPAYLNSSPWRMSVARMVCGLYTRVVCVSPAILDAVPNDRTEILPACLPVARGTAAVGDRLAAWIEGRRPLLSTALFFRPEYGFDVLSAAMKRLREAHPALGCVVMGGTAPYTDGGTMFLTGDLDHDTCLALMARSDVFVRPTLQDGDSISVREALSLGVPVVASRVGTRPDGVVLFRPGDAEDLASKVEEALAMERRDPAPVRGCLERLLEIYEEAPRKTGRYDAARAGV